MQRHQIHQIVAWISATAATGLIFAGAYKSLPKRASSDHHESDAKHDDPHEAKKDDSHHQNEDAGHGASSTHGVALGDDHAPKSDHEKGPHEKKPDHGSTNHKPSPDNSHEEPKTKHEPDVHHKEKAAHGNDHSEHKPEQKAGHSNSHSERANHGGGHVEKKSEHVNLHQEKSEPHQTAKTKTRADETLAAALQPNWSYQLTASAGPKSWSTLKSDFKACGDPGRQSPIELASSKTNAAHHALKFQYVPLEFTLTNNGMWTVLQPANSQNTIFWKDQTYHFEHAQLRSPGEHTIKGVRADLELQLYHRSKSGQRVAVAAQLTERAEAEHPVLKSLLQHIPTTQSESAKAAIDIAKLLPIHHDFYNYTGSVTFPPCTSNVEWFVLKEPVAISGAQVDYFASIFKTPAARPVQSHSTQAIAESASAADVTGH